MALKMGKTSPHPGLCLRAEVVEPLRLSVTKAAEVLGVRRAVLSDPLTGQTALSREMAQRFEKVFGASMEMMLKMQAGCDAVQMRGKADALDIERYVSA